jgi:predicted ribosome quality control (RQC) complex YloA/Tae2 family protein
MKKEERFIQSLQENIEYCVGKNAEDNFDIIDDANDNDIWFHLNNAPSTHIIACIDPNRKYDKKQMKQIVTQGALLCKQNSKKKSDKNVEIIYAKIKDIEKTDIIGSVNVNNKKIIII